MNAFSLPVVGTFGPTQQSTKVSLSLRVYTKKSFCPADFSPLRALFRDSPPLPTHHFPSSPDTHPATVVAGRRWPEDAGAAVQLGMVSDDDGSPDHGPSVFVRQVHPSNDNAAATDDRKAANSDDSSA